MLNHMTIAADILYCYLLSLSKDFDSKHIPRSFTFLISHYLIELTLNIQAVKSS